MFLPRLGRASACLALGGAFLLGAAPAHAFLSFSSISTVAPLGGVNFSYTYKITPGAGSSPVSELDVPLSGGGALGALLANITMPTGFQSLYAPGAPGIRFISASSASDILPGVTGTFSFTSLSVPLTQGITYRTDDGSGSTAVLQVFAPSPLAAVPEAPAGALLALGLLPLGLLVARRRRSHAG